MTTRNLRIDGPEDAAVTVLFAHGAGIGMDAPYMAKSAAALGSHGVRVVRFEFPYMAKTRDDGRKRPPDRMPALLESFAGVAETIPGPLALAGKSLGARVALALAKQRTAEGLPPAAALCFGFPFHPPGKPETSRLDSFDGLTTPTLVLQGGRDPFGTFAEAQACSLPGCVTLCEVPDGDHGFKPRKASGHTEDGNIAAAAADAAAFLAGL